MKHSIKLTGVKIRRYLTQFEGVFKCARCGKQFKDGDEIIVNHNGHRKTSLKMLPRKKVSTLPNGRRYYHVECMDKMRI